MPVGVYVSTGSLEALYNLGEKFFVDKEFDCFTTYRKLYNTGRYKIKPTAVAMDMPEPSEWVVVSKACEFIYNEDNHLKEVIFYVNYFTSDDSKVTAICVDEQVINVSNYINELLCLEYKFLEPIIISKQSSVFGYFESKSKLHILFEWSEFNKSRDNMHLFNALLNL